MDQTFMHLLLSEFMGTALMIIFGVGVHCDDVLKKTKYAGSGHLFAITTWGSVSFYHTHNMGIRYHCCFIYLRWCKYQPCYGAC